MDLFKDSAAAHVDLWGGVLVFALCGALVFSSARRVNAVRLWKHHPYRQEVGRYVTTAAFACSILFAIAAFSHMLRWPVYGKPIVGAVALGLFMLIVVIWRTVYLRGLREFESRWPEVAQPRAELPKVKLRRSELVWFAAAVGGLTAYLGFFTAPWTQSFHLGTFLLGGLVGVVISCLYLVVMNDTARLERSFRSRGRKAETSDRARELLWWIVGAGFTLVAVGGLYMDTRPTPPPPRGSQPAGVETFTELGRLHVQGNVSYDRSPPAGGDHAPVWLNCGVYDQPVSNENVVHSLEHGAVWIAYQRSLSSAAVASLRDLVESQYDGSGRYVILSPVPGLESPVVATAWGHQLKLHHASDPRIKQFIEYFREGPQDLESGAPCIGGTGSPIS